MWTAASICPGCKLAARGGIKRRTPDARRPALGERKLSHCDHDRDGDHSPIPTRKAHGDSLLTSHRLLSPGRISSRPGLFRAFASLLPHLIYTAKQSTSSE